MLTSGFCRESEERKKYLQLLNININNALYGNVLLCL